MYHCQACGRPCSQAFPCAGCQALYFCSDKHRARYVRAGQHPEDECQRMREQLARCQELRQPFFTWWPLLNPDSNDLSALSSGPTLDQVLALLEGPLRGPAHETDTSNAAGHSSSAACQGLGLSEDALRVCWAAHQRTDPASPHSNAAVFSPDAARDGFAVPGVIIRCAWPSTPSTASSPSTHPDEPSAKRRCAASSTSGPSAPVDTAAHTSGQPSPTQPSVRVTDWQSLYTALSLQPSSPAALVLHFMASMLYAVRCVNEADSAVGSAAGSEQGSVHSVGTDAAGTGPGDVGGRGTRRTISSMATHNSDNATLHVLYLGPESELQLLSTLQALHTLIPLFIPFTQTQTSHTQHTDKDNALGPCAVRTSSVWVHFIGPHVPAAWHGQCARVEQPACTMHGPREVTMPSCEVHVRFWHGCLHDVVGELSERVNELSLGQSNAMYEHRDPSGSARKVTQSHEAAAITAGNGPYSTAGMTAARSQEAHAEACVCGREGGVCPWGRLRDIRAIIWAPNSVTSDYCEEALVKAQMMISALFPTLACVLPPHANPFRQPWTQTVQGNALPSYSNGFVTAWKSQRP